MNRLTYSDACGCRRSGDYSQPRHGIESGSSPVMLRIELTTALSRCSICTLPPEAGSFSLSNLLLLLKFNKSDLAPND
jgi:hypothetical protein